MRGLSFHSTVLFLILNQFCQTWKMVSEVDDDFCFNENIRVRRLCENDPTLQELQCVQRNRYVLTVSMQRVQDRGGILGGLREHTHLRVLA